jgi:MoCo/4Fe-4S cofactor protein with predicted Tat translocation signal
MSTKKYWKGLPELTQSPEFLEQQQNEFAENLPLGELVGNKAEKNEGTTRRDFLKFVGFTTAAAALASCETPVTKSIPYVVKPDEVTPGVANFYASTFYDGYDFAPVWVKTREGRPIKIEGNELSGMTNGATSARLQASVLSIYDSARLTGPMMKGAATSWAKVDAAIADDLKKIKTAGGKVVLLSSTIISPSTKAVVAEFTAANPNVQHVTYDAVSYSALRFAHNTVWGKNVIPSYDFSAANTIVGIACDFLGNWLNPIEFASQYGKTRKVSNDKMEMSKHYHFEANLSLTGANADERYPVKPSEFGKIAAALFNEVAKATGNAAGASAAITSKDAAAAISKIAKDLVANKGKSLVVCGINDNNCQVLCAGINKMLDNYGKTLDADMPLYLKQGDDKIFSDFVNELMGGKISGVMFYNCNPAYTIPAAMVKGNQANFANALKNLALSVSFSQVNDETAQACKYVCPDHNYLESWGDANPKRGTFTLQQPAISPLFGIKRYADAGMGTRQFQDTLLKWAGKKDYYTYLQAYWQNHIYPFQSRYGNAWDFWSNALHNGGVTISVMKETPVAPMPVDSVGNPVVSSATPMVVMLKDMKGDDSAEVVLNPELLKQTTEQVVTPIPVVDYNPYVSGASSMKGDKWEIHIYEKVSMGIGNQTNNPWLMEMPDPLTKVTWDNYITMNPADVKAEGYNEMLRQDRYGSYAKVTVNGVSLTLPVFSLPGQAIGTIGIALGYGRNVPGFKVANGIGQNAFPLLSFMNGNIMNVATASVTKEAGEHLFAGTQIQHTIMGREDQILRETKLDIYKEKDKLAYNPPVVLPTHEGDQPINDVDLWDAHPRPGHKWALNIDLNSCIGCGACVIACHSENNVAVVGKDEVSRSRDMHWLRIDRYFTSDMNEEKAEEKKMGAIDMYLEMETPSHNPKVTFQPMLCQHCNHAPCETVCPVLATNHSTEGLNQMTYNRCIGTRYCANNCPYKVRRFNWWNYNENPKFDKNPSHVSNDYSRMVLNPDVVVRSRGVMEKCSMCQQRLQAGKSAAKKSGAPLKDGAIKTACQQACPTKAITFGDANDPESAVSKTRSDDRNYFVLEELGVKPNVSYLVKVRNEMVTESDKKEAEYRKKRFKPFMEEQKEKMKKMMEQKESKKEA